jgi:hypothetical protein
MTENEFTYLLSLDQLAVPINGPQFRDGLSMALDFSSDLAKLIEYYFPSEGEIVIFSSLTS